MRHRLLRRASAATATAEWYPTPPAAWLVVCHSVRCSGAATAPPAVCAKLRSERLRAGLVTRRMADGEPGRVGLGGRREGEAGPVVEDDGGCER